MVQLFMGIKESFLGELRLIVEVKSYSWASTSISRSGRDGQSDVSSFPRKVVSNRTGLALKEFPLKSPFARRTDSLRKIKQ